MSDAYTIRCPVCLTEQRVEKTISVTSRLNCGGCRRSFEFRNALPGATTATIPETRADDNPQLDRNHRLRQLWPRGLPVAFIGVTLLGLAARGMDGPEFLWFYAIVGVCMLIAAKLVRWLYVESFSVSTLGALAFVALGLARYVLADEWLERWWLMWVLMAIGFLAFFMRYEKNDTGNSQVTFFGTCGGCGGGGCGGGCGGCG